MLLMIPIPPRVRDLTGMRFGTLVVLSYAGLVRGSKWSSSSWNVRCTACNTEKVVRGRHLTTGQAKSCGPCGHKEGSRRRWSRPEERERARAAAVRQFEDPEQRRIQSELKHQLYGTTPPPHLQAANDMRHVMAALRKRAQRTLAMKENRLRAIAARAHALASKNFQQEQ